MEVHSFIVLNITLFFLIFLTVDSKNTKICRLMFKETKDSQQNLCKTAELLTITIELENSTNLPDSLVKDSYLFQPLIWKRISGNHGKGLLQLKPVYEMLSLSLLSYETEETTITLQSKPQGCVENLTELEYERIFRNFLLNFTKENDEICNEHIGEMSGYARFYHECCQYDQHGNMQCNRVLKNKWMQAIQYCTYIVIIIVVLYCPLMIPSSLYDPSYGSQQFVYCLKDSSQMFNYAVKKTCSKNECQGHNKQKDKLISYAKWKGMKKVKDRLKTMNQNERVKVSKIYFSVRTDEMLATNEVPTSLFNELYDLFFKCSIRKQKCVAECCEARICGDCLKRCIRYPLYKLLRFLLRIVLSVTVCLPWIIRICFFYFYEYEVRESRHKAAETRNLLVRIENNLAYYGTPIHVLFIFSYFLLCFGYIFLELTSLILFKKVKCLVRDILTKCFDGMYSPARRKVVQKSIIFLLKPCKMFGIFGMLIWPPYWICVVPIIMAVFSYYFFPAVYIIVNFVSNFICLLQECICKSKSKSSKKKTDQSKSSKKKTDLSQIEIGIMFILLCIMVSSLLLTVELVIFLIRVAIYTMVGVILNSSHAMQYISIISLAWLYYRRCFGGIGQIYKDYNKAVHSILYRVNKRQLNDIATKESKEQENTAFKVIYDGAWQTIGDEVGDKQGKTVKSTDAKHDAQVHNKQDKNNDSSYIIQVDDQEKDRTKYDIDTSDRTLKFKTNSVMLLLDQYDKQYITKTFFFEVCKIKPDGPGPMKKHFVRALRQFGIIILFLIFVTLVVLAFGDSYSMTFSNQLLATLAGGVVPLILMKTNILFAQAEKIDVNELVSRYFSDQDITNETILSNVQKLQKSLQEMKKGGVNENEKIDNKKTEKIDPKAENSHQLKNGEVIVKGVFKKYFNEQIGKDEKWWNIADIDMIEYDESHEMKEGTVDLTFCMCKNIRKKYPKNGSEQSSNAIHSDKLIH